LSVAASLATSPAIAPANSIDEEPLAGAWWDTLRVEDQQGIDAAVRVLEQRGPGLGRPLVDSVVGSRHANMKELRVGTIRILFAFDPRRLRSCCSAATSATAGRSSTRR